MSSKNTKVKTASKSQPVAEPVKQAEPVVQKGGKKSSKQSEQVSAPEPVVETKQTEPVVQKGGKKSSKQAEPVVEAKSSPEPEPDQQEGKVEVEEDEEQQTNSRLRYFKLIYNDEVQGRYCGKKPKQAANKAFSSIIKDMKKGGNQQGGVNVDINFSIRECTRNSKHKEYKYVGIRESLKEPVKVAINNEDGSVKEITYNFHNKIQKAPKA